MLIPLPCKPSVWVDPADVSSVRVLERVEQVDEHTRTVHDVMVSTKHNYSFTVNPGDDAEATVEAIVQAIHHAHDLYNHWQSAPVGAR